MRPTIPNVFSSIENCRHYNFADDAGRQFWLDHRQELGCPILGTERRDASGYIIRFWNGFYSRLSGYAPGGGLMVSARVVYSGKKASIKIDAEKNVSNVQDPWPNFLLLRVTGPKGLSVTQEARVTLKDTSRIKLASNIADAEPGKYDILVGDCSGYPYACPLIPPHNEVTVRGSSEHVPSTTFLSGYT